ncbi:type VI secretion system effector [Klebsiella pneumoniae]|nr:type VI secretion system effector [Klebsiella pneumoniae]
METLEMRYEAITWKYMDGNIYYCDSWNDRRCA